MKPQNFEETIVWYSIVGIYVFYFTGALYFVGPIAAYLLLAYLIKKLTFQSKRTPEDERIRIRIPFILWIWVAGMLLEQAALVMGHLDFSLGLFAIIKSTFGWATGWALLAIFPLIGCLKIRPQLVYRAVCVLGLQSLIFFPLFYAGFHFRINDGLIYTSPLEVLGGGDAAPFQVKFYGTDEAGAPRLSFFAPYVTVTGLLGNIFLCLVTRETHKVWRWAGILGSLLMCIFPRARLAILCLLGVQVVVWLLVNFRKPALLIMLGVASAVSGITAPILLGYANALWASIKDMRASSTDSRELITRVALYRFKAAPIWGHGVVDKGTQFLSKNPAIGTHNTIIGLLYVKGLVGLLAFLVPMFISFIDLLIKFLWSREEEQAVNLVAFKVLLCIAIYSLGATIDTSAYLTWPGLLFIGMAHGDVTESATAVKTTSQRISSVLAS
jgi:hypothetical protein